MQWRWRMVDHVSAEHMLCGCWSASGGLLPFAVLSLSPSLSGDAINPLRGTDAVFRALQCKSIILAYCCDPDVYFSFLGSWIAQLYLLATDMQALFSLCSSSDLFIIVIELYSFIRFVHHFSVIRNIKWFTTRTIKRSEKAKLQMYTHNLQHTRSLSRIQKNLV